MRGTLAESTEIPTAYIRIALIVRVRVLVMRDGDNFRVREHAGTWIILTDSFGEDD